MADLGEDDIKFTDRLHRVLFLARGEAARLRQVSVGTEHLLLGLILEEEGIAPTVLLNLGVDLARVRIAAESMGRFVRSARASGGSEFTTAAEHVLEMSIAEARSQGYTHVSGNHLLIALLREDEGVAVHALREQGVECDDVRGESLRLLGGRHPSQS